MDNAMSTFNELVARYEAGTDEERQRVLDMLPQLGGPLTPEKSALARELWEKALRTVFGGAASPKISPEISHESRISGGKALGISTRCQENEHTKCENIHGNIAGQYFPPCRCECHLAAATQMSEGGV